jgi:outer membrane protein OmpA-like peptidoglycan-associated protein
LALPLLAATLLLTSCVSGGDGDSGGDAGGDSGQDGGGSPDGGSGENREPIASSVTTTMTYGPDLQIDIFSLERESDDMVVLEMAASNVGEDETVELQHAFRAADGVFNTPDGVTLIDPLNQDRYYPLMRSDGDTCLCTEYSDASRIEPGQSVDIWVAFPAPPEEVTSMAIATPVAPDFMNVPLTQADQPDEEITGTQVADARILPLSAIQDSLDGETSREESGDETSIMLASDVLFDLNESDLTSDADEALQQVATEIDESGGDTIRVDGYTDNSGNDSINNPLSEDRAESVRDRLEELVTRDGISFEVEGHGSADPVADNSTEEGREKNRRVTVTFEK